MKLTHEYIQPLPAHFDYTKTKQTRLLVTDCDLYALAEQVVVRATKKKIMLTCAESCTAGLVAATLGNISGCSAIFEGGVVSYSNRIKPTLLNVSNTTLQTYGAVSGQTACEMAVGVKNLYNTHVSVSTTGIAGPTGSVGLKPVGLVWFGCAIGDTLLSTYQVFSGNRLEVRRAATYVALSLLFSNLES